MRCIFLQGVSVSSLGQGQSHQVSDYKWPAPDCLAEKTVFTSRFLPAGDCKVCPLASYMFDKSDEEHWYALKVFYNRVFDVERLLAQDGVKTYIPLRSTETTVGGRTIRPTRTGRFIADVRPAGGTCGARTDAAGEGYQSADGIFRSGDQKTGRHSRSRDGGLHAGHVGPTNPGLEYLPRSAWRNSGGAYRCRVTEGVFKGAEGYIRRVKGNRRLIVSIEGVVAVATTYTPGCFLEKITTD